jgi:hypothetical protein
MKIQINRTREKFLRVRVNDAEFRRCKAHAETLGFRSLADWLRDCANRSLKKAGLEEIPQQQIGAPKGNKNKAGKKGANQNTNNHHPA